MDLTHTQYYAIVSIWLPVGKLNIVLTQLGLAAAAVALGLEWTGPPNMRAGFDVESNTHTYTYSCMCEHNDDDTL